MTATKVRTWPAHLRVLADAPLAPYSYFGIGGRAQYLAFAEKAADLAEMLEAGIERGLAVAVLGNASNVLIGDDGVAGLVIVNRARAIGLDDANRITVESGVLMGQLARFAADNGIGGFEFGLGIPGTVGGSIYGNAGCFGSEIASVFEKACIWRRGGPRWQTGDELGFGYRRSALLDESEPAVVIEARLRGFGRSAGKIRAQMRQIQERRRRTQPSERSAGSIFKNPPGNFAGRLIEAAGLKGLRVGAAQVSDRHANFIVNRGGANASEVAALITQVRRQVHKVSGVLLEPEIRRIGSGFGGQP